MPDERWPLLPLVPLVPKRLVRSLLGVAADARASVVSSNIGAVNPAANRPDGTDADYFVDEVALSGRDQGDDAPRSADCWPCSREERTDGSSSRSLHISRAAAIRMTNCDRTFRAR